MSWDAYEPGDFESVDQYVVKASLLSGYGK